MEGLELHKEETLKLEDYDLSCKAAGKEVGRQMGSTEVSEI